LGKWGIGRIHFLIPLLVVILTSGQFAFADDNISIPFLAEEDGEIFHTARTTTIADYRCDSLFTDDCEIKEGSIRYHFPNEVFNQGGYVDITGSPFGRYVAWGYDEDNQYTACNDIRKKGDKIAKTETSQYNMGSDIENSRTLIFFFSGESEGCRVWYNLPTSMTIYEVGFTLYNSHYYDLEGSQSAYTHGNDINVYSTVALREGDSYYQEAEMVDIGFIFDFTVTNSDRNISFADHPGARGVLEPGSYVLHAETYVQGGLAEDLWDVLSNYIQQGVAIQKDFVFELKSCDYFVSKCLDVINPYQTSSESLTTPSIHFVALEQSIFEPECPTGFSLVGTSQCVMLPLCPEGTYFDGTNCISRSVTPIFSCTEGTTPRAGQCIGKLETNPCTEGFAYNFIDQDCEITPDLDCSGISGTELNIFGVCEIATIKTCPGGLAPLLDNPLVCTSDATCPSVDERTVDGNCERAYSCPSDSTRVGDKCHKDLICPSDTSLNAFGDCEKLNPSSECHRWNYIGPVQTTCAESIHYHCPSGTSWNGVACIGSTSCPSGYSKEGYVCVKSASCPSGYTKGAFVCYKPATCPSGATKNLWACTADVILSCPSGTNLADLAGIGFVCTAQPKATCTPPSELKSPEIGIAEIGIPLGDVCKLPASPLLCPPGSEVTFLPTIPPSIQVPSEFLDLFEGPICYSKGMLTCPDGMTLDGDQCTGTMRNCPSGTSFSTQNNRCEGSPSCPSGSALDAKTNLCTLSLTGFDMPKLPGDGLVGIQVVIPKWVKDVAGFWCADEIGSSEFVQVIQWMIKEGLIMVPQDSQQTQSSTSGGVPDWIQFNACIWYQGEIGDKEFSTTLQWLIDNGIIKL